jgi:hypothetical protein
MDDALYWREARQFDEKHADNMRKQHLNNTLDTNQKMELYNCAISGNLDTLKNLIEQKKYPLMEECSAAGYYWTVLHYAAHYGFHNIVNYIVEMYQNDSYKKNIVNLQSNLGLSPLFISLNSSSSVENKKNILDVYVKYDAIDFKICSKENEDIYDICKKNKLLDYFLSILKED